MSISHSTTNIHVTCTKKLIFVELSINIIQLETIQHLIPFNSVFNYTNMVAIQNWKVGATEMLFIAGF